MPPALIQLSKEEFKKLSAFVYEMTGIFLPEEKQTLLANRLRKRLRALGLDSFTEYHKNLLDARFYEEELPHFLSAVTTNETYFFRNENLWRFVREKWIPELRNARGKQPGRSIRIWSAASSSGEEAYTAAICLCEELRDLKSWNVSIVGTDISDRVLTHAREGVYNDYAVSRTAKPVLDRWFSAADDKQFTLKPDVRKLVRFQFHNLRDPMREGNFDLVFLRNVLMYFDTAMKVKVLRNVCAAIAPGGYLVIGDVDPVRSDRQLSAAVPLEHAGPNLYRKCIESSVVAPGSGRSSVCK